VSPLRDYWRINLGVLRLNFSWSRLTSWSVHLWVATWNSQRGWTVNVKAILERLLPHRLCDLIPGRLFWQQTHHRRARTGR
jgi:hypothetical protein